MQRRMAKTSAQSWIYISASHPRDWDIWIWRGPAKKKKKIKVESKGVADTNRVQGK